MERKKRLLKKQKREEKMAEKEKIQEKKINHWKAFQNSNAGKKTRQPSQFRSTDSGVVGVVKGKADTASGATGVRQKWTSSSKLSLPDNANHK